MRVGFWFGGAIALTLVAIVAGVAIVATESESLGDKLVRGVVPGDVALRLAEPGVYTIYHEHRTRIDGRVHDGGSLDGLRLRVVEVATGEAVRVGPPTVNGSYSRGDRAGVAVFSFRAGRPGAYRLIAAHDDGSPQPRHVLSVSLGLMQAVVRLVTIAIGTGFTALVLLVLVVLAVVRSRRRR